MNKFTEYQVREMLRRDIAPYATGVNRYGLRSWCRAKDVKHPGPVTEFLRGKRGPPPEVLNALGLEYAIIRRVRNGGNR